MGTHEGIWGSIKVYRDEARYWYQLLHSNSRVTLLILRRDCGFIGGNWVSIIAQGYQFTISVCYLEKHSIRSKVQAMFVKRTKHYGTNIAFCTKIKTPGCFLLDKNCHLYFLNTLFPWNVGGYHWQHSTIMFYFFSMSKMGVRTGIFQPVLISLGDTNDIFLPPHKFCSLDFFSWCTILLSSVSNGNWPELSWSAWNQLFTWPSSRPPFLQLTTSLSYELVSSSFHSSTVFLPICFSYISSFDKSKWKLSRINNFIFAKPCGTPWQFIIFQLNLLFIGSCPALIFCCLFTEQGNT